jgi:transcriptional regulator with XRE-family HTH domain
MSKPYSILREKMKPAARKKAAVKTKVLLDAMPLQELRHARNLSQEQLAQTLSVKQAAVSKLEKRTDMYISTLRNFIKAMGGDLEIIANFPDGSVQISQFEDIAAPLPFYGKGVPGNETTEAESKKRCSRSSSEGKG